MPKMKLKSLLKINRPAPLKEKVGLPDEEKIKKEFNSICRKLNISPKEEDLKNLVVFDMTDGTRTSTNLTGADGYIDGGLFVLRLFYMLNTLGAKNAYANVIVEKHKDRVNYDDIYEALRNQVGIYTQFAKEHGVKIKFLGDYKHRIEPRKKLKELIREYMDKKHAGEILKEIEEKNICDEELRRFVKELEKNGKTTRKEKRKRHYDLRKAIKAIEKMTSKNRNFNAYFLINYSTRWAMKQNKKKFKGMPDVNAIIRHTKGYVGGDMWIYDKFDKNTFVYAQNGSSSINWSDRQLLYLIGISLRSMMINGGSHQTKIYREGETGYVRKKREQELAMINKNFYDKKTENKSKKRIVIFGVIGPEIYEF